MIKDKCTSCEKSHDNWPGMKGILCQECWEAESSSVWWDQLANNRVVALQHALDTAVEALKFYAEPTNYESICPDNAQDRLMRAFGLIKPGDTPEVKKDNGQIAKTALTSIRSK